MQPGISTHVLLQQRLHPGHLDAFARAGARHIELFAARHHFDYTDRSAIREIANWFRANDVIPSLHQPLYTEARWSRHVAPTLNLIAGDKSRRIYAMDEVKRALETAEQIPLTTVVLHLGLLHDPWTPHSLEHSLTAIEHLKAFASPLGIRLLLENLHNEVTAPDHLLEIVRVGHFETVGACFNIAHAHLSPEQSTDGILPGLELLKPRIATLHLSDNDGRLDQHLWPGSVEKNGIDFPKIVPSMGTLPPKTPWILEIAHDTNEDLDAITRHFTQTLDNFRRLEETANH